MNLNHGVQYTVRHDLNHLSYHWHELNNLTKEYFFGVHENGFRLSDLISTRQDFCTLRITLVLAHLLLIHPRVENLKALASYLKKIELNNTQW